MEKHIIRHRLSISSFRGGCVYDSKGQKNNNGNSWNYTDGCLCYLFDIYVKRIYPSVWVL